MSRQQRLIEFVFMLQWMDLKSFTLQCTVSPRKTSMRTKVKTCSFDIVLCVCKNFPMQLALPHFTYMSDNGEFTFFVALLFWTLCAFFSSSGFLISSGSEWKKSFKFKEVRRYKNVKFLRLIQH
jgi:hypothetical protein